MYKKYSYYCLVSIFVTIYMFFIFVPEGIGGPVLPCGDPLCDIEANCLGTLCSADCKWCPGAIPGDRCVANSVECTGGPLNCGDPQCDVEDNCLGSLCSDDCKWCPDALPGDRCVSDFVECTVAHDQGPVTQVPSLSQWGIIFTSLFLGLIAAYVLKKEKIQ